MSEHLARHPLGWRQASHGHSEHLQGPGAQLLQDKRGAELRAHGLPWEPPAAPSAVTHRALVAACPAVSPGCLLPFWRPANLSYL